MRVKERAHRVFAYWSAKQCCFSIFGGPQQRKPRPIFFLPLVHNIPMEKCNILFSFFQTLKGRELESWIPLCHHPYFTAWEKNVFPAAYLGSFPWSRVETSLLQRSHFSRSAVMDEIISRHCFLISKANALLQFIPLLQFFLVRISAQPFLYKSASPRGPNAKVYNFSSILVFISPQAFSERNIRVVQL